MHVHVQRRRLGSKEFCFGALKAPHRQRVRAPWIRPGNARGDPRPENEQTASIEQLVEQRLVLDPTSSHGWIWLDELARSYIRLACSASKRMA